MKPLLHISQFVILTLLMGLMPIWAEESKPNIIYILADDIGYGDLSCYGQQRFTTPHLDRMASEGMRFTDHYSGSALCAPSRYTLLTGRHIGHAPNDGQNQNLLDVDPTLAKMLKKGGYTTAGIGKWGLANKPPSSGQPNKQGFDFWYGFLDQRRAHFHYPEWLWRNDQQEMLPDNPQTHQHHTQDLFTKEALNFISQNKDKPFFLYLPYTLVHAELIVPEQYEQPFIGKLDDTPIDPKPYGILKEGYNLPRNKHAAFAGAVSFMDSDIGKIFALLKQLGIDENTLVIFSSDNGPHSEGGADPTYFDSNGPYSKQKGSLYEGGIRVPMIVRWPGKVAAGTKSDHLSYFPDILPTLGEICHLESATGDGISMAPTLLGTKDQQQHKIMYWSNWRQRVARSGNWKLIRLYETFWDAKEYKELLYDIKNDPAEETDVATDYPELVRTLSSEISSHEKWKVK